MKKRILAAILGVCLIIGVLSMTGCELLDRLLEEIQNAMEEVEETQPGETTDSGSSSSVGTLNYSVNSDGTTCTIRGKGTYNSKDLVIPETIGNYTVTAIGSRAFYWEDSFDSGGFSGIYIPWSPKKQESLYDLQGCKLEAMPSKGIYIQNGKKIVVK